MNLMLEKRDWVTMGDKSRGWIRGEVGKFTGMVLDAPTIDSLGKRYGAFGGLGMAAGNVEVLLVVILCIFNFLFMFFLCIYMFVYIATII